MTVRWKPLVFLSGVFLIVAVIGVSRHHPHFGAPLATGDILQRGLATPARAGRFTDAEIYFKQALQKSPRTRRFIEEFAELYRDWARQAPAEKTARDCATNELTATAAAPSSTTRRARARESSCCKRRMRDDDVTVVQLLGQRKS